MLGAPTGSSEFVLAQLSAKSRGQRLLFQRIPAVPDLQSALLLLLLCGARRANFWLRMMRPELTAQFAEQHDGNVWQCLATLLGLPEGQPAVAVSMPLNKGGLGLGSAVRSRRTAHWASWADCLSMVHKRDPAMARWMVEGIQHDPAACFQAVRGCQRALVDVAFEHPPFEELLRGRPLEEEEDDEHASKVELAETSSFLRGGGFPE